MSLRPLAVALALGLSLSAPLTAQSPLPSPDPKPVAAMPQGSVNPMRDSLAHARRLTQWFYAGQADSLRAYIPDADRPRFTNDVINERLMQLTGRAGTELEVIEEKFVKRNGQTQYWRTARFSLMSEPVLFRWVLDPTGHIIGQGMGPRSQAPPIDP
jgi:hypothetical protein